MEYYEISSHVFLSKVSNHQELKPKILNAIENMGTFSYITPGQHISNTDFHLPTERPRPYFDLVIQPIQKHLREVSEKLQIGKAEVANFWYQQYKTGDYHGFHVHQRSMFSNAYYVQLDNNSPKTLFNHMGVEFEVEIEEGCILTFPSYLFHGSPPNESKTTKTVISFNIDFWPN